MQFNSNSGIKFEYIGIQHDFSWTTATSFLSSPAVCPSLVFVRDFFLYW